ncbi:TetR/AcrR family transcriptional regulator [Agromyces aurantiacus]|uniref:TetR/AcrR family transcriptional regulator n=1 Tax=Agromyces aurantiacus TaxID=165814 RepID=A0ABV9QZL7_9MICO|nr:TetR family transcriptional regulator [Agromyces aurantiacus]MBM7505641.1 AcrR family transcriptional regulator [Agromyces aurantiacus]
MPDRRTTLADTALALVAEHGVKALTHRAVDAAAAVPPGTTSNHFRTRRALLDAVADRLEARDLALWEADADAAPPGTPDELAERLARYLEIFATSQAELTRARFAFSIAEPEAVVAGHGRFMVVAERMVEAAGVDDAPARARWLADYCDGMLLHQVTARRGEPVDEASHRAALRRLLD